MNKHPLFHTCAAAAAWLAVASLGNAADAVDPAKDPNIDPPVRAV